MNDVIVDGYLNLIATKEKSVIAFSSYFYKSLKNLKNFFKDVDLFKFNFWLFPILLKNHWIIVIYDHEKKEIALYDSLEENRKSADNHQILNNILNFLKAYNIIKFGKKLPFLSKVSGKIVNNIPNQTNYNDCGVYILKFAEYICSKRKIDFDESSIPLFKAEISKSLISGEI